uniref:Uncharacterized protein n=1 Tax=viral metagenome TaxID=1070528 RepID=A0A6H1ZY63_9ZZZZ
MKVIDAHTGIEVKEGMTFENINGINKVLKIHSCYIEMKTNGYVIKTPLAIRWLHPSFLFRKIGFIPS